MKKTMILALIISMVPFVGCSKGMINVGAIDGIVQDVTIRHDNYVNNDPDIDDEHRSAYLRSSQLLREIVAEARK